MPPKLTATYYEDSDPLDCTIIKRGKKRTRILLAHGITKLVPSELVVPDRALSPAKRRPAAAAGVWTFCWRRTNTVN